MTYQNDARQLTEYSLHLYRCAAVNTVLDDSWPDIVQELNLDESCYNSLYDWCVKEVFARILAEQDIRVIGHYRWDEALCVVETYLQPLIEFFKSTLQTKEISKWKGLEVKLMVFGSDMFIAKPLL